MILGRYVRNPGKQYPTSPVVKQLRERRLRLRLTLREVSKVSGLDHSTIAGLEYGHHFPKIATLEAWAQALGYTVKLEEIPHWNWLCDYSS